MRDAGRETRDEELLADSELHSPFPLPYSLSSPVPRPPSLPICTTCGVQYAGPQERCAVCEDERQYVGWEGQRWTSLEELRAGHTNRIEEEGPGLLGVGTEPAFAIGQRALHVQAASRCILWDCISLVDGDTVARLRESGGVSAIAVSHPHYYSAVVEWSRAFGGVPIYLHADDRQWVMRSDPAIVFWDGETLPLADDLTLLRCGGHFAGGTVLHWAGGADGRGMLLSGDIIQVCQDRRWVSFMYSFPNYVPLGASAVRRILSAVEPFAFDDICGAWWRRNVRGGAKAAVRRSADRYLAAIAPD